MKNAGNDRLPKSSRLPRSTTGKRTAGFYVADKHGNISVASHSFARLLQYSSREEVLGLNMAAKMYESENDRGALLKKLAEEGQVEGYAVKMIRKDGTRVVLSAHCTLLLDEKGEPVGVEGILEDMPADKDAARLAERPIPELAPVNDNTALNFDGMIKDQITGLCSYPYFMTCLDSEIRRVERVFHPTCLMMLDLDNFSAYNQKFGREKGDELLKTVAGVLTGSLKATTDIICRQSRDQFLAILPETKKDEAVALAKKVKDDIQAALKDRNITCSIGMSRFVIGMSVQEFFLQANLGLYMAKEVGKNEACLYG